MRIFVKIYPVPGGAGTALASYEHPIYEKTIHRLLPSLESALAYKQEREAALSTAGPLFEMTTEQFLLLFKEERPSSLLFKHRSWFVLEFLETFGALPPRLISEEAIDAWIERYAAAKSLKEATIGGDKCFLNYFFRYLIEKGVLEKTPITGIGYNSPDIDLTTEEAEEIVSEAKRLSPGFLYPMALISREAKVQTGEVYALRWKHVDLKKGKIIFDLTGDRYIHTMSEELRAALSVMKRNSFYVFTSNFGKPVDGHVMIRARGEFRRKSSCKKKWALEDLRRAP